MDTKRLVLPPLPPPPKSVAIEKPKTKRVITKTDEWSKVYTEPLDNETFSHYMSTFRDLSGHSILVQQIRQKIAGYRSQDVDKGLLDKDAFVTFSYVAELLHTSECRCYYCQAPVLLLYEYVREPKQWTLERLNNTLGHNKGNVVIACLQCNLRRRCIHSDRYVKTKQMSTIVKLSG